MGHSDIGLGSDTGAPYGFLLHTSTYGEFELRMDWFPCAECYRLLSLSILLVG